MKNKRQFLAVVTAIVALLLSVFLDNKDSIAAKSTNKKAIGPNVVFIVIDALRPDHLSFNDYFRKTSPFIDSIVKKGIYFKRAYSQESYTQASMPSIFTSQYPIDHRVLYNKPEIDILDDDFITLAEVLKDNGYSTGAVVFNLYLRDKYNFDQGFDMYGNYYKKKKKRLSGKERVEAYETASKIHEKSLKWLANNDKSKPFFLYLHYMDVHEPYLPPSPYNRMFIGTTLSNVSKYDALIAYIDYKLSLLFKEINKLSHETIYIISADHGEEFGEHGHTSHGYSLYEESIRIPLIIYSTIYLSALCP